MESLSQIQLGVGFKPIICSRNRSYRAKLLDNFENRYAGCLKNVDAQKVFSLGHTLVTILVIMMMILSTVRRAFSHLDLT